MLIVAISRSSWRGIPGPLTTPFKKAIVLRSFWCSRMPGSGPLLCQLTAHSARLKRHSAQCSIASPTFAQFARNSREDEMECPLCHELERALQVRQGDYDEALASAHH